jgi:hypothetical protein
MNQPRWGPRCTRAPLRRRVAHGDRGAALVVHRLLNAAVEVDMRLTIVVVTLGFFGCSNPSAVPPPADAANDPSCQIASDQQHSPGWPFDLPTFKTTVLPTLVNTCAAGGCHAAPNAAHTMLVWTDAAPGNCSYAKTFNSFVKQVDLANPTNSAPYVNVTGGNPKHPLIVDKASPMPQALLAFIQAASAASASTTPPPVNANPFDFTIFQTKIEPILDTAAGKGCTNANCHGAPMGQAGFKLATLPAAGSADMQSNFNAITAICNLQAPDQSKFYFQATHLHGGGNSAVVTAAEAQTILDWIKNAAQNAPANGGGGVSPSCAAADKFNLDVFTSEIQPILFGTLDLNDPTGQRTTTGCARSTCHGVDRTGGALVIKQSATPQQNLQNFACFANLANPTASPVLLCPLNAPGCPKTPHPGQNVFLPGAQDLNYQRILSYIYGSKTAATPLDFAFYVRQINTIFNDVNAVQNGAQNRTCADTVSCHGIQSPGQRPPNGSIFAIIANAGDKTSLLYNFGSAANFTNFISPQGSSLFLFPTDEIANLANPFATGLHHPGGLDFAVDSPQALSILAWAQGLRPDDAGFSPNWLVAGTYPVAQITDPTAIDEINITPSIFDPDGAAQFNGGQWDGLFSPSRVVDLNGTFPQAQNSGRVAYAVAYVLNTSSIDIQAQITITSPNAIKLYVGKQPVLQASDATVGATGLAVLPAYGTSKTLTRLLLKVFQRAGDQQFQFQTRFQDQFGNPLTNFTGELVFKLSPDGGI